MQNAAGRAQAWKVSAFSYVFLAASAKKRCQNTENTQIRGPLAAPRRAAIRGASWCMETHAKCIDFHMFSIIIFKQHNNKYGNQSSAGSAQAVPHTWGLWPPDRPSRPAARRRIVAGLPAQAMLATLKTLLNSLFYKWWNPWNVRGILLIIYGFQ